MNNTPTLLITKGVIFTNLAVSLASSDKWQAPTSPFIYKLLTFIEMLFRTYTYMHTLFIYTW